MSDGTVLVTMKVSGRRPSTAEISTLRIGKDKYDRDQIEAKASGREPIYFLADDAIHVAQDHPTGDDVE